MSIWRTVWLIGIIAAALFPARPGTAQNSETTALAYVHHNTVTLAGASGTPTVQTGPIFTFGQGARLFWTANGQKLYIARDDGLYATGPLGGAAVQMPGHYGRTLTIAQDGDTLYYLESASPQVVTDGILSFPIRELSLLISDGGTGRLAGYYGRFDASAKIVNLTFAAALYARDGGLLGSGRPNLWPSYGSNLFGTCCFPNPGLARFNVGTGDYALYDETFIPGAAAVNLTRTHLAGPTTGGAIRVIDLITGGTRDYQIEIAGGLGTVERIAWSPDDTWLYIAARSNPDHPLELTTTPPFDIDTRSANITVYRLNLVTSVIRELASRSDVYGVSSLAATDDYVFAVVVDSNSALIDANNQGLIPAGTLSNSPTLDPYLPTTHLWRIVSSGGEDNDIADDVWGVVARPMR